MRSQLFHRFEAVGWQSRDEAVGQLSSVGAQNESSAGMTESSAHLFGRLDHPRVPATRLLSCNTP